MAQYMPTYCTPDEVAETIDLPSDDQDNQSSGTYTDMTHPTYNQVCRMICANEDVIDRRLKRSWKVNFVKDRVLNVPKYWQDENAWRLEMYRQGGNQVQLRKDVLPWDPTPIQSEEEVITNVPYLGGIYGKEQKFTYISDPTGIVVGEDADVNGVLGMVTYLSDTPEQDIGGDFHGKYQVGYRKRYLTEGKHGKIGKIDGKVVSITENPDNTQDVLWNPMIYGGDKLEVRTNGNKWVDITSNYVGIDSSPYEPDQSSEFEDMFSVDFTNNTFWIDNVNGRLFIKKRVYMPAAQGLRISYRWGTPSDELPAAINRLACLLTACNVLNMQAYHIKLGTGGDVTGIKESMIHAWQEEANSIWASYQRPGSVFSLLR